MSAERGGGAASAGGSRSASRRSAYDEPPPQRRSLAACAKAEAGEVLLGSKMNLLLLPLPFALAGAAVGWPPGLVFVLALLPLCSLAERLGMVTEQLALYTNDSVGGLLNATFGNATEVIIAAFAIKRGFLRIVKLTLLGSIVSNLLLVLGCAFIAGGARHQMQHFNAKGVGINSGLLILSVISVALPTLLSSTSDVVTGAGPELALSRFESILMLLGYGLFLVFQLVTHKFLYEGDLLAGEAPAKLQALGSASGSRQQLGGLPSQQQQQQQQQRRQPGCGGGGGGGRVAGAAAEDLEMAALRAARPGSGMGAAAAAAAAAETGWSDSAHGGGGSGGQGKGGRAEEFRIEVAASEAVAGGFAVARGGGGASGSGSGGWEEDEGAALVGGGAPRSAQIQEEEEDPVLSLPGALLWLAAITLLISLLSDAIMDVITAASMQLRVPMPFLTTILVPIVGNAAEHASALMFAMRNRMEVALGVAVGSSTQVGVLVIPFCVVLAWAMGQPLDLNFNEFEASVLFISVLLAVVVLQDGSANYLKGVMLVMVYAFVSAGFWLHKDPQLQEAIDAGGSPR